MRYLVPVLILASAVVSLAAQRTVERVSRALYLNLTKDAWIATPDLPGHFRFCAAEDRGVLRGCVTVAELRSKAASERIAASR